MDEVTKSYMLPTEYRAARIELEMTQSELAKALGVTRATVNRRETQEGRISTEAELALAALRIRQSIKDEVEPMEVVEIYPPDWFIQSEGAEHMKGYNYTGHSAKGWLMMEKLDGCFAKWTGKRFVSKGGKQLDAPARIADSMPQGVALVGELWAGRGKFEQVVSAINGGDWSGVEFVAFDLVDYDMPARERQAALKAIPGVKAIDCTVCTGKRHLKRFEAEVKAKGGEGVILLKSSSKYVDGRSIDLQKVKSADIVEVKVIGWNGKSLDVEHEGKAFKVAVGAKPMHAKEETVFVSHYGFTSRGIPRHAVVI
jgi:DNA ligase-1